jgi:hypothetical protein
LLLLSQKIEQLKTWQPAFFSCCWRSLNDDTKTKFTPKFFKLIIERRSLFEHRSRYMQPPVDPQPASVTGGLHIYFFLLKILYTDLQILCLEVRAAK